MQEIQRHQDQSIQALGTRNSNSYSIDGNFNSFRNYYQASSLNTAHNIVDIGSMQKNIKQNKQKTKLDKLDMSIIEEGYTKYNPYQIPPNWKLAEIHRDATSVGKPKKQFNQPFKNNQVCPCCGFQLNKKKINMMDNYTILSFLGSGYPLFFSFTKYCLYILATILFTSGAYNLWTNYNGKYCLTKKQIKQGLPLFCEADYISTLTIINKANDESAMAMQNILNLFTTILLIVLCLFYRNEQKQIDYDVDAEEITPSDYTIMIKGIPQDMTEQELKEQLVSFRENDEENNDPLVVSDITYIYNVKHVKDINNKVHLLVKQKQEALKKIEDENSEEFRNVQSDWDDKIYFVLLQSLSYLKCVKDDKTQFTGYAFVSFEQEEDKQFVLQSIDKTLWESIKDYLFSLAPEYKELTLKKTNTVVQMTESPEPLDIIWDNLTMKDSEKGGIRKITFYSTLVITIFCAYIIYLLNQYQNENSNNDDYTADDLSIFYQIMQQFSFNNLITSTAIIFINSFIINLSFAYFVNLERYNTYTIYNVQLAKKLTIALFINSALVITFISFFVTKNVYKKGGLIYTTFYYFVIDTFLSFVSTLVDEEYYYYLVQRWWYSRKGSKSRLTQEEAHKIYQYPKHEIEMCYAELMNNMYICVFFSSAIPIGLIFQLVNLTLYYWITKYILIRQKRVDYQISAVLSLEMTNFLEMLIPTYAISNALFELSAVHTISTLQMITIAISVLFSAVPVQVILENIVDFDIQVEEISYSKAIFQFTSTYKKEDPFSSFERRYFSRKYRDESFVELN
ncbi:hypothetical protein ABPG72_013131 [Tetrahymena utriculariae]